MNKKYRLLIIIIAIAILTIGSYLLLKDEKSVTKEKKVKDFNSRIIRELNKNENNNYLISPYSIEIALNMLRDGANGKTKEQIDNLIGQRTINNVIVKNKINVANGAFIKDKYKNNVTPNYYDSLKTRYNADILFDEFKTPKVINDWVDKETNGMIKEVIKTIDDSFALGLANAVAIDVEWKYPFDCTSTTEEEFIQIDNKKSNVSMMHKTYNNYDNINYFDTNEEKGIIIPYKTYDIDGNEINEEGNSLEFIGILPNGSVKEYVDNINEDYFTRINNSLKEIKDNEKVSLSLPMFKYEYEVSDFKTNLMNLGIKDVFDSNSADLSNMIKSPEENFYVSDAIHKTYIDLNEKGTKAAAVTAFIIKANSAMLENEPKIIEIKFSKPFVYIIRDTKTKELLFFGVVYEPLKWEGSTCK